jgi:hypothetical protein
LNFRATVCIDRNASGRTDLVITTAVMFHNAWGRRYMAVIKPIHRRLVPCYMRSAQHAVISAITLDGSATCPAPVKIHELPA